MRKILPLLLFLAVINSTHASVSDYFPEPKLTINDAARWNVGAGISMKLLHVNMEWVNPYGIAYTKLGAFLNNDHAFGAQVGIRYPIVLTGTDKNGYYLGAYAGHLKSKAYGRDDETQLGGGIDLAFVLLNQERISTFSVGIGAGEKVSVNGQTVIESKPAIQFAYTLSLGL